MKKLLPWLLGGLLLLLLGIVLLLRSAGAPPSEIAELVTSGGEKILREPMRPARGGRRVIVFALDGVGADELRDAIAGGRAPNLAALLGAASADTAAVGLYANAYAVPGVLSILPSTTVAAWASLFTGEPPGRSGIPGNEWFVRQEARFYAPAPVTIEESGHALQVYTDDLVGSALRVATLYERAGVRAYVSLSQIHRGADLLITPDLGALGDLVTGVVRGVVGTEAVKQEAFVELDDSAMESVIESLEEHGLPDLLVVYIPGVDLYTHVAERPLEDQRAYVRDVIDVEIGELLALYRAQGALEQTTVLFTSDHGHTPVLNDERHALGTEGEEDPPGLLERAGFRMRPYVLDPEEGERDFQATVAYQGAFAYVYLADRSTCASEGSLCDWTRPPRFEQDVLPVVRAFDQANRTGAGAAKLRGTLDLVFARRPAAAGAEPGAFEVWDGERLVPIGDYLAANPRPELLELESRVDALATGPYGDRAGDVLLLARTGAHLPIEERFYFSGLYRSWHGSPTDQDSRIPLVVARPGASGEDIRDEVRAAVGERPNQLDVARLIEALLRQ